MANRNVSQLPENTDPQDTDWLLGASGNSPSVLQKMAVGNIKPANGSGGSIKFPLPINQNHTLTSSGYYFTDNTASDIEINCLNLGVGEHIYWLNLSSKSVVFSGLNSIDSVSIPANKGVKISSTNFIQFFLKDANKNLNKIAGNQTIDWIPGYIPPQYDLVYSNNTTYNGLFNYLGTNQLQSSWENPSPSKISITNVSNAPLEVGSLLNIVDKNISTAIRIGFFSFTQTTIRISLLNNVTTTINRVLIAILSEDYFSTSITVKGIKEDNTTETLFSVVAGSGHIVINQVVSTTTIFKGLELSHSAYRINYKEIEVWGTVFTN